MFAHSTRKRIDISLLPTHFMNLKPMELSCSVTYALSGFPFLSPCRLWIHIDPEHANICLTTEKGGMTQRCVWICESAIPLCDAPKFGASHSNDSGGPRQIPFLYFRERGTHATSSPLGNFALCSAGNTPIAKHREDVVVHCAG